MIEALQLPTDAPIVDVGGGASGLAGELLGRGYSDLTVADISEAALEAAKDALGEKAGAVSWVRADVREHDFGRRFAVWHDRAVLHFMTEPADRIAYLETLRRSLLPGGHLIVATFGPDGPTTCSGLPVLRYGADDLERAFAGVAHVVSARLHDHQTPSGKTQQFIYAHLTRSGSRLLG
jgi:ubiquinone/menaquinone biosynthesis C-methylase UbiE